MGLNKQVMRREGFWGNRHDGASLLPMPASSDGSWLGKAMFLTKLEEIEEKLVPLQYRGFSTCRICGVINGSQEYEKDGWVWPSGFAHYVKEHNVRPSLAFQEFILGHHL